MKIFFILFLVTVSTATKPAFSANHWHGSTVRTVYPLSDGDFILILNNDNANCTSPETPHYYYVRAGQNSMTVDGVDKLYASVLTAAAANIPISINFSDSTSSCFINRMQVQFQ